MSNPSILGRTPRLVLRQWSKSDVNAYHALVSDPDVMQYIGNGEPRLRSYAENFVDRMIRLQDDQGWMRFVVAQADTGAFMGFCGFDTQDGRIDFGWRYAQEFWGAGYGFEAAAAAYALARETWNLRRITSQSYPDNVGSVRIIEKLGMKPIGEYTAHGQKVVVYGDPTEWPGGIDLEDGDCGA